MKKESKKVEKKIEVCPSRTHKNSLGHGRIDSAEGCLRYFQKRFKQFTLIFNAGVAEVAF